MEDKKPLIWIVDDSRTARVLLEDTLTMSGYSNVRVFDGTKVGGKELISELEAGNRPDVVITDYNMPLVDGLSVAQEARKYGIKTIIFSFDPDPIIKLKAFTIGAEFCEKPYTGLLMEEVNKALTQTRAYHPHTQSNHPAKKQSKQHGLDTDT